MKDGIPTKKVTFSHSDLKIEVEIYEWLTEDETQELTTAVLGDREYSSPEEIQNIKLTPNRLGEYNRVKLKSLCKDLDWDKFTTLHPVLRNKILEHLDAQIKKKGV